MFGRACLEKLEDLGDKALDSRDYSKAIRQYTAVEPLVGDPDLQHALLLKRSKAHAENGPENWKWALQDADQVQSLLHHVHASYMHLHISIRQSD